MLRHDIPIQEFPIQDKVNAGIAYVSNFGEVPEIELREAAVYCHYNYTAFCEELSWWERACCVAQYRLHFIIEANVAQANENNQQIVQARTNSRGR